MTKPEMLKEYIIRDVIDYYATDNGLEVKEAMSRFYHSEVFSKLDDVETGLYLSSSPYVYDLFCDEMQNGKVIQNEI